MRELVATHTITLALLLLGHKRPRSSILYQIHQILLNFVVILPWEPFEIHFTIRDYE